MIAATSTNGRLHHRNRLAKTTPALAVVEPLDAVSDGGAEADGKPAEGRTAKGTFAAGNRFARGNPNARRMAALRSALIETVSPERMAALGERLYAAALAGDWNAAKLFLTYAVGRPTEAVDADRLDLDEFKLLDASPTFTAMYRAMLNSLDPAFAVEILQGLRPADLDAFKKHLYGHGQTKTTGFIELLMAEQKARVGK